MLPESIPQPHTRYSSRFVHKPELIVLEMQEYRKTHPLREKRRVITPVDFHPDQQLLYARENLRHKDKQSGNRSRIPRAVLPALPKLRSKPSARPGKLRYSVSDNFPPSYYAVPKNNTISDSDLSSISSLPRLGDATRVVIEPGSQWGYGRRHTLNFAAPAGRRTSRAHERHHPAQVLQPRKTPLLVSHPNKVRRSDEVIERVNKRPIVRRGCGHLEQMTVIPVPNSKDELYTIGFRHKRQVLVGPKVRASLQRNTNHNLTYSRDNLEWFQACAMIVRGN